MKKVIAYFIKYPVAVNIIIIAFVILGILGFSSLKSSFFPLTDAKNITINVAYPGASPQEMEEGIVLKIEDNLKGLVGVDRVTSTSSENSVPSASGRWPTAVFICVMASLTEPAATSKASGVSASITATIASFVVLAAPMSWLLCSICGSLFWARLSISPAMRSKAKKTANPHAADVAAIDRRIRIIFALMLDRGWRRRLAVFFGCFVMFVPIFAIPSGVAGPRGICPSTGQIFL